MSPDTPLNLPGLDEPIGSTRAATLTDEVDTVLFAVKKEVDARYSTHGIEALLTKTTRQDTDQTVVLDYAFYLSFANRNRFSYRLFEVVSQQPDGGFPVTVEAWSGPPVSKGQAQDAGALRQIINEILGDTRTRWIINTYYQP
jgi:hypothetical protein